MKATVLILCTGNSCRSQIAHGYLEAFGKAEVKVYSAGLETHGVNPRAIAVMREDGIDISNHTSNHVSEYESMHFDYVITVCDHAHENCPYFPATVMRIHQNFPDPAKALGTDDQMLDAFRTVRDSIREYVRLFIRDIAKIST